MNRKTRNKPLLWLTVVFLLAAAIVSAAQTARAKWNFSLRSRRRFHHRKTHIGMFTILHSLKMIDRIRSADAAFTNFEMLVHNFEAPGAPMSGGTYMQADPFVIDELKWAGFRLFQPGKQSRLRFWSGWPVKQPPPL